LAGQRLRKVLRNVSNEQPILEVTGVVVAFGAVVAVNQVSVTVPRGVVCGLIGPNGSGKTTFLGAISRFVPVQGGSIAFEGVDITKSPPYKVSAAGMSRTFQAMHLLDRMTVRENVMAGVDFRLAPRTLVRSWLDVRHALKSQRAAAKLADQALERVGMSGYGDVSPAELPYGMQRRVEIARALAVGPKLLLLDEPVAGMNDEERREISQLVRELRGEGLTQILVEHDLATIHRVCDMAYVLNFGEVIAQGTPAEVVDLPAVREAYLGHASLADSGEFAFPAAVSAEPAEPGHGDDSSKGVNSDAATARP
jgi:branched-chain amino acid transport system ATP-binding protein